ncbi:MAG: hypothetical protein HY241_09955 [Actinobacteria bacterium]|nr:hypothetical protein [Actinomycetota bacterium]
MTSPAADLTAVRAASELLAFGLSRTQRPLDGSDYHRLLDRYRTDLGFRDTVDTIAEGLGLDVIGTPRTGLVLVPDPSGPFATRLADLRPGMPAEDKLVAGLVLLALAAYAYPNEVDLDDTETKLVNVVKVDEFIRAAIGGLSELDGPDGSAGERARTAAATYANLPSLRTTPTGRRAVGCTLKHIEIVCDWLVEQGAAREARALGADTFQLTDRFRLLVADSAGSAALAALREARRTQITP